MKVMQPWLWVTLAGLLAHSWIQPAIASTDKIDPAEQQAFIDKMVSEHNFTASEVERLLSQANRNQDILEAIQRPWEAKPWYQYHPIFLTEKRIAGGVKFWAEHKETLARAEQELGVPAHLIVAIIGVETFYGTYKGKYEVLDALYTLGFHYPPRQKFFRQELAEFMLLMREEKLEPDNLMGSYAGAMGFGQFISSSYRYYAIDFDNDGQRDLFNNPVDAIGSVANYFRKHGWTSGHPVAFPLSGEAPAKELISGKLKPAQTVGELTGAGLKLPEQVQAQVADEMNANVLELEIEDGHEYWLTLPNFYVITRYNHSPLYAMAVYQLSEQIKQDYADSQQ
ncbi:membrane-bound lytic murein transglycosylase B [Pseudidiomarina planktonica]|uniref:Membrane-bound lytic murein transglycosylase B n=1 Tax=Pseudidiomarina planktonica TaxID=1323738 RepID=A0A1Y6EM73_9GAMM|nr:lytic murein transglycosylase B [Pseudidiomarina planktonica]SMQ63745.1 membrane-bound lytic murein transglycosylase B [Pseudidiomarina planktonica]